MNPSYEIEKTNSDWTDYWDIFVRRRWVIFSFCLITTTVMAIASFMMQPVYRATTSIVVEGEEYNVLATDSANKGASFDIFENYLSTQMEIILSRSVAGKVFEQHKLGELEEYKTSKDPVKQFTKSIFLERLKGTRVIKISVDMPDPELAAKLANSLSETYAQDNLMRRALTFIRNQRMASFNQEYLRLQDKLASLSTIYGPLHPDMINLKHEIRKLATQIEAERSGMKELASSVEIPENVLKEHEALKNTLQRIQEDSVFSSSRMNNIFIADKAIVPKDKIRPKRILNIAVGFFGGLIGGIFLAFVINYLDDSIKTEEDLKKQLGSAVIFLGALPVEKSVKKGQGHNPKVDQLVSIQMESPSAEAYRLIRTRILWSVSKDRALKDMAVLSSVPGEGKTTVASNLAIAFSQLKLNTLLVDTDIRRGRLHESYGLSNEKGLGHYLMGTAPFKELIGKTEMPNLFIVTCGKSVIDSSQLFTLPKMSEFIREARERYDMIVYDTPPVTIISDAGILTSQLHGAVMVSRSGVTRARELQKALSIIKASETKLMGAILNASDSTEVAHYNKYYQKINR